MAKVRNHCFRAIKPPNLPKVGVGKYKVGGANLEVGGTAATPTVEETPLVPPPPPPPPPPLRRCRLLMPKAVEDTRLPHLVTRAKATDLCYVGGRGGGGGSGGCGGGGGGGGVVAAAHSSM